MIRRKSPKISQTFIWPLTPDLTPRGSPILSSDWNLEDELMAGTEDEMSFGESTAGLAVPNREGAFSPSRGPLLSDILSNNAPPPYTLTAFMAFLSQNHCLETLEFTMDARKYHEKFDTVAASMAGMPITSDCEEGVELQRDWKRILDIYIVPGAPREINLPSDDRDELLEFPHAVKAPPPETLDQSIQRMYDLMQESIYLPFINSFPIPYTNSQINLRPPSEYDPSGSSDHNDLAIPRTSYEDNRLGRHMSRRRQRSPQSTSMDITSSRHLSALRSTGHQRHSTHLTQQPTSASATTSTTDSVPVLTDDSGSASSPSPSGIERELMTPPTTPPSSELGGTGRESMHASPHSKSGRSDSGGWKRMSQKLSKGWSKKKSAGHLREGAATSTAGSESITGKGKSGPQDEGR